MAVGTIAYCSPEQLLGLKCGFASDIYSFGVVRQVGWEVGVGLLVVECSQAGGHLKRVLLRSIVHCLKQCL